MIRQLCLLIVIVGIYGDTLATEKPRWFEGGNLHAATLEGWLVATPENRLATAADFAARYMAHKGQRYSEQALRQNAERLVECVNASARGQEAMDEVTASMAASVCLVTALPVEGR